MRATLALALALVATLAAGCGKLRCKHGTVLVTVSFDAASRGADALDVVVTLDGNAQPVVRVDGPRGSDSGTVEVDFPSGYSAGKLLSVTVTALQSGMPIGSGSASQVLLSGCSVLTLPVTAQIIVGDMATPDMLMLPAAAITSTPDLVGFVTTVDGTSSTDPLGQTLSYAWSIVGTPTGSAITTTSLSSTTTAKPRFEPDRGGVYKVALTVTAPDGRAGTTTANVTVPTVPIFYARTSTPAFGGSSMVPRVMRSDGTGDHDIACNIYSDMGMTQSNLAAMPFFGHAYDPPPGGTPLFAFLGLPNAMPPATLLVGSPTTSCTTSPPVRVDNNTFADHIPIGARFSPDGTRLVYINMPNGGGTSYELVTVAVDGVGPKHVVRSSGNFSFTPAIWLDNSTVAWLESDSTSTNPFTIFKAPDVTAAGDPGSVTRMTVLRCDQGATATHLAQINQFQPTPFGMLVAGSTSVRCLLCTPPESAVNLYLLAPNDCSTANPAAKTLVTEPTGGLSWDFDVSPDGLTVLFSSTHGQAIPDGGAPEPQSDIFVVPTNGSSPAQKLLGDTLYDDISPRFIAGGRQIVWTRKPRNLDMGADTPAIMLANADATHLHAFTSTAAAGETVLGTDVGSNRGFDCSGVPGSVGASAATACVGIATLLLLALRRRRRD